jgi:hypothetical protein
VPVLLHQELLGPGQVVPAAHPPPELQLVGVDDRGQRATGRLAHDPVRERVDGGHLHAGELVLVVEQQRQVLAQHPGERGRERGEQHPAVRGAGQQVLDPVQSNDGLSGARTTAHLRRPVVRDPVGDAALRRVQEHPPCRERLVEDVGELVRARDERDAGRGVEDRHLEAVAVGRGSGNRAAFGHDVAVDLLGREALGEVQQHLVLVLRQQTAERLQLGLVADRPGGAQHLVVDAEVAQHGVGEGGEQQRRRVRRRLLQRRRELLDRDDVAHLQPAGGGVDGVEPLGREVVGVVVGHDPDQQEDVASVVRGENDPAPEVGDADGPHPCVARLVHRL